ncbi:MAG TPA: hypothetical protein VH592_02005 [Gemmataceae bacterium]
MRRFSRNLMICGSFMAMALLVVCWVQCRVPALPLENWHIPELVEQLNRAGVKIRTVAVQKIGPHEQSAFLTTSTEQDWPYLNRLVKDAKRIHEWKGIVYCERRAPTSPELIVPECEQYSLTVGPFYFFGDTDLLARIGTALGQPDFHSRSDATHTFPATLLRPDRSA